MLKLENIIENTLQAYQTPFLFIPSVVLFSYYFQGAQWRASFKSFSARSVFGKSRLRGLLVVARSLLAVAKKSGGPSKGYHCARRRGEISRSSGY